MDPDGARATGYVTRSTALSAAAVDDGLTLLAAYYWGQTHHAKLTLTGINLTPLP